MVKLILAGAFAVLLIASTTAESLAMARMDWPNGGTCMGGPRGGRWVRDLKFCNASPGGRGDLARQAAKEKCKKSAGRPIFRACMQNGGSQDSCKSEARPNVRACVTRTLGL